MCTSEPAKLRKSTRRGKKESKNTAPTQDSQTIRAPTFTESAVEIAAEEGPVLCGICFMDTDGYFCVQCDRCPQWYHYECPGSCHQTDVDESLLLNTVWLCNKCATDTS